MQNTGRGTRSKVLVKTIEPNNIAQEKQTDEELKIYPNPCRDYLTIEFPQNKKNTTDISFYNMLGNLVMQEDNITTTRVQMNLAHLPQGYYLLSVNQNEKTLTGRFLKQ